MDRNKHHEEHKCPRDIGSYASKPGNNSACKPCGDYAFRPITVKEFAAATGEQSSGEVVIVQFNSQS